MRLKSSIRSYLSYFSCFSYLSLAFVGSTLFIAPAKAQVVVPSGSSAQSSASGLDDLISQAKSQGSVRVIVGLKVTFKPEGSLVSAAANTQRVQVALAQNTVLSNLAAYAPTDITKFQTIPYFAANLNAQALQALSSNPNVISIQEDVPVPPTLAESTSVVKANNAWASGFTGAGQTVAILDTGVASSHSFLSGKVVSEACYSSNDPNYQSTTVCPNGAEQQTGTGAGVNCPTNISGCDHGTHVAGIAAGRGPNFSGVAKDANIIAIQVFSRFDSAQYCGAAAPCVLSYTSDQIAGLERVYALRTSFNIAAVNMSLGGGQFTSNCDGNNPSVKAIIDNLRSANIATVIASGNNGFTNALSSPACISSAISVGSTGDGSNGATLEGVSSFSNSASFLSLLAPGASINSSIPGGGFSNFQGTSMATPHVAGDWAVFKQKNPSATVADVLTIFQNTGVAVTDSRNNITKSRINVFTTLGGTITRPPNDNFANSTAISGSVITKTGTNVNATKESGEPNHAGNTGGKSVWWSWTAPGSGRVTITTAGSAFDTILGVYKGLSS